MRAIVGSNLYSSLLISKSLLIFIVGRKRKDHTPRSLDNCLFATHWALLFGIPFLVHVGFTLTGRLNCAKCEKCHVRMFMKQSELSKQLFE